MATGSRDLNTHLQIILLNVLRYNFAAAWIYKITNSQHAIKKMMRSQGSGFRCEPESQTKQNALDKLLHFQPHLKLRRWDIKNTLVTVTVELYQHIVIDRPPHNLLFVTRVPYFARYTINKRENRHLIFTFQDFHLIRANNKALYVQSVFAVELVKLTPLQGLRTFNYIRLD